MKELPCGFHSCVCVCTKQPRRFCLCRYKSPAVPCRGLRPYNAPFCSYLSVYTGTKPPLYFRLSAYLRTQEHPPCPHYVRCIFMRRRQRLLLLIKTAKDPTLAGVFALCEHLRRRRRCSLYNSIVKTKKKYTLADVLARVRER